MQVVGMQMHRQERLGGCIHSSNGTKCFNASQVSHGRLQYIMLSTKWPRKSTMRMYVSAELWPLPAGHRNQRTVKGVSFFGEHDEYVCSGSGAPPAAARM